MRELSKLLRDLEITSGRGFLRLYGSTEGSMSKVVSSAIFDSRRAMIAGCAFEISSLEQRVVSAALAYCHIG